MTLPELREKVKELRQRLDSRELYTMLLIVVVGFGSFCLGRLSKFSEAKTPLRIEQIASALAASPLEKGATAALAEAVVDSPLSRGALPSSAGWVLPGGQFVSSKGGAKYHFPWCAGASQIAEKNKLWFNSVEEARKAGYTPASNCKGLK